MEDLFKRGELTVSKKTKNGIQEQDILPMMRALRVEMTDQKTITMNVTVCCQNPSLNPVLLVAAVERYLPDFKPDHALCRREELLDVNLEIFR